MSAPLKYRKALFAVLLVHVGFAVPASVPVASEFTLQPGACQRIANTHKAIGSSFALDQTHIDAFPCLRYDDGVVGVF